MAIAWRRARGARGVSRREEVGDPAEEEARDDRDAEAVGKAGAAAELPRDEVVERAVGEVRGSVWISEGAFEFVRVEGPHPAAELTHVDVLDERGAAGWAERAGEFLPYTSEDRIGDVVVKR